MTLENYVLEQSINMASVDDIMLEQAVAEFEVAVAILECYQKEEVLLEYCSDTTEFNVFMESDNETSDAESSNESSGKTSFKDKVKGAGKAIANVFVKAWNMLVQAIVNFINITFVNVDFGKIANRIDKKFDDSATFNISLYPFDVVEESAKYLYEISVSRIQNQGHVHLEELQRIYDKYFYRGHVVSKQKVTKAELVDRLKKLTASRDTFNEYKKWNKTVKNSNMEDKQLPKPVLDMYIKIYRELTNDYVEASKLVKKCVNMASNETRLDIANKAKEAKKNAKNAEKSSNDDSEDEEE